mmetsp:Transcript_53366/g.121651  ORF Transcript_53366/g.121651 Transcript_53366/m.121651 type:complete len:93 (-) Transcript_53366:379-657(-)
MVVDLSPWSLLLSGAPPSPPPSSPPSPWGSSSSVKLNWVRRVLSKVTAKTLVELRNTEERFGDAVTFKGKNYSMSVAASRAFGKMTVYDNDN